MSLIVTCTFAPVMQKLVDNLESTMYFIVRQDMTRDEAIMLRDRLSRPLGILSSQHDLVTHTDRREKSRSVAYKHSFTKR